jgi:hypothetical protein
MSFLHTLLKTRLRILIISLIILITFISTVVLFRLDSLGIKMKFIAQTPPGDFLITTEKAIYQANETTITTITSAMPNTPIYWQNAINDIDVSPPYQYGQTDAEGNYTRVIENHGQYGVGAWKFFVAVGGISKHVEFVVGAKPYFTVNCHECSMQDGVTFSLVGAAPNSPIYWSSTRNYIPTGEVEAFYGHSTDQDGSWMGSTGSLVGVWQPGQWVKEVKVGGTYLTVEFAVGAPYAETGSLRWYALRSKAEGETETIIGISACGSDDLSSISLCEALQKYSFVHANVKERQTQVLDNIIYTWWRLEVLEVFRNRPYLGGTMPDPPPEILSHMGPNDVLVYYIGGKTTIEGVNIEVTQPHTPETNFGGERMDLFYNLDSYHSLLIMDWNQTNRIGDLSLYDKSVALILFFHQDDLLNQHVDPAEDTGNPLGENWLQFHLNDNRGFGPPVATLNDIRQWLANHPGC